MVSLEEGVSVFSSFPFDRLIKGDHGTNFTLNCCGSEHVDFFGDGDRSFVRPVITHDRWVEDDDATQWQLRLDPFGANLLTCGEVKKSRILPGQHGVSRVST